MFAKVEDEYLQLMSVVPSVGRNCIQRDQESGSNELTQVDDVVCVCCVCILNNRFTQFNASVVGQSLDLPFELCLCAVLCVSAMIYDRNVDASL